MQTSTLVGNIQFRSGHSLFCEPIEERLSYLHRLLNVANDFGRCIFFSVWVVRKDAEPELSMLD